MPSVLQLGGFASLLSAIFAICAEASDTVTWSCYRNDSFTVLATDKPASVGSSFIVRRSTNSIKPDCAIETRATDRVLGSQIDDALYYISLRNNFLILDEGTGPDRSTAIYELGSGKLLLSAPYPVSADQCAPSANSLPDEFRIDDSGVTFWRATREKANAQNCPRLSKIESPGLEPTIEEKTLFRFATGRLEGLKAKRCVSRQAPYNGHYILDGITRDD